MSQVSYTNKGVSTYRKYMDDSNTLQEAQNNMLSHLILATILFGKLYHRNITLISQVSQPEAHRHQSASRKVLGPEQDSKSISVIPGPLFLTTINHFTQPQIRNKLSFRLWYITGYPYLSMVNGLQCSQLKGHGNNPSRLLPLNNNRKLILSVS